MKKLTNEQYVVTGVIYGIMELLISKLLSHNSKILLYHSYSWHMQAKPGYWPKEIAEDKLLLKDGYLLLNINGPSYNKVANLQEKKKLRITGVV